MPLNTKAVFLFCFELCHSRLLFRERTALYKSSANGNVAICKLLIESKADVNAKNRKCGALSSRMPFNSQAGFLFVLNFVILVFFAEKGLHCIGLLKAVAWTFVSSLSRLKLT